MPVVVAIIAGLLLGLAVRGLTASDSTNSAQKRLQKALAATPTATRSHEPKHRHVMPPASGATRPSGSAGIPAALTAVDQYSASNGASVGIALVPLDRSVPVQTAGNVASGHPWSTMKVPAAAAYLNFKAESAGASSGEETIPSGSQPREDLGNALVNSDNVAIRHRIQEMLAALGRQRTADSINAVLENGGAHAQIQPVIDPSIDSLQIGTGEWTLEEAAEWFRRLQVGNGACLGIAPADRTFLLKQLHAAPEALHWGAAAALPGDDFALKPGWGSEGSTYTVEQAVIVGSKDDEESEYPSLADGYVMVLMTQLSSASPGAFTEGQHELEELAELVSQSMGTPGPAINDALVDAGAC
jgi:hypothetical protein